MFCGRERQWVPGSPDHPGASGDAAILRLGLHAQQDYTIRTPACFGVGLL
jgi:hypothetical protein